MKNVFYRYKYEWIVFIFSLLVGSIYEFDGILSIGDDGYSFIPIGCDILSGKYE